MASPAPIITEADISKLLSERITELITPERVEALALEAMIEIIDFVSTDHLQALIGVKTKEGVKTKMRKWGIKPERDGQMVLYSLRAIRRHLERGV